GEEIVARARRIIEASDEVVALARSQRDPLAGPLRLALLPTIGPYLLPRVAPAIRRALPRLELRLYEYQTAPMLERLRGGELDVGILALPVELDGLESHELYREAFVVALPERRPAPLCAARAGAARRRRVAQDERAAGGDRCVGQAHRRARPVSAPASPSPLELTASDGRTLAGLVLEAPGARGALAINGATGF